MFLRNFYNLLFMAITDGAFTDTASFGDGHINYKSGYNGSVNSAFTYESWVNLFDISVITSNHSSKGIIFGTGDTAVSFDDYKLDSIASNLSGATFTKGTPTYDSENNKFTIDRQFLLTNNNSSSITLKEIGLNVGVASGASVFYPTVYREVLATPITLAAGESVTYTHTFEFTMPTIS